MCRQFVEILSNRRQRVVLDGATSDCIPIASGMSHGNALDVFFCVLGRTVYTVRRCYCFMYIPCKIFDKCLSWWAYADDSTLLAVVHKPTDRPAVDTSSKRELATIQEWCYHWCKILNPNKIKAIVSRSRTVKPPHWSLGLVWLFPFMLFHSSISLE